MSEVFEDMDLRLTYDFDAPQELVYRAWTEPDRLAEWCYPKDFIVPFAQSDITLGGHYRTCLRSPDGTDHWVRGTYTELVPFRRVVFTHGWEDDAGNVDRVTTVSLAFEALGPKRTRLTLTQTGLASIASRDGHAEGWRETLDNLAAYLVK